MLMNMSEHAWLYDYVLGKEWKDGEGKRLGKKVKERAGVRGDMAREKQRGGDSGER